MPQLMDRRQLDDCFDLGFHRGPALASRLGGKRPGPERRWLIRLPDEDVYRLVKAPTRSEARARLKRQLGLRRLPEGTHVEEYTVTAVGG